MKIFLILITLIIATNLFAETDPPKVTTQQFQNWTYQCVEDKKTKTCEVSQNIRIQNSNINFSVRKLDFFEIIIDIEVRDANHLQNIIAALRMEPEISSLERLKG